MLSSSPTGYLVNSLLLSLPLLTAAQTKLEGYGGGFFNLDESSLCSNSVFSSYNATSSVTIPGLNVGGAGSSNWTISTAIKDVKNYTTSNSSTYRTAWIDTNPFVDLSSDELQFTGCMFQFFNFKTAALPTGANASNTCDGVFGSSSCMASLLSSINSTATGYANSANKRTTAQSCDNMLPQNIQDVCKDLFKDWTATALFGNHTFLNSPTTNASCPSSISAGNASATAGNVGVISYNTFDYRNSTSGSSGINGTQLTDFIDYDNEVRNGAPIIVTGWVKNASAPLNGGYVADTKMVCVNNKLGVVTGSRVPTSGVGRLRGRFEAGLTGVAVVMAFLAVF